MLPEKSCESWAEGVVRPILVPSCAIGNPWSIPSVPKSSATHLQNIDSYPCPCHLWLPVWRESSSRKSWSCNLYLCCKDLLGCSTPAPLLRQSYESGWTWSLHQFVVLLLGSRRDCHFRWRSLGRGASQKRLLAQRRETTLYCHRSAQCFRESLMWKLSQPYYHLKLN